MNATMISNPMVLQRNIKMTDIKNRDIKTATQFSNLLNIRPTLHNIDVSLSQYCFHLKKKLYIKVHFEWMMFYSDNLSSNCSEYNYVVKHNETQWNSERLPIKESQFSHQNFEYWIYVQPWKLKVQNLKSFLHCFCRKRSTFCRAQRYSLKMYHNIRIS